MNFVEQFWEKSWIEIKNQIYSKTESDVEKALKNIGSCNLEDFMALLSPKAQIFLEEMAKLSQITTLRRFGKTIQMFVPLYLSNECNNICTYCGFSLDNPVSRKTLTDDEIKKEVQILKNYGFDHVLLVTGESQKHVNVNYLENAIRLIRSDLSNISIEVQPLLQRDYERLKQSGLHAVLVYQETYGPNYKKYHLKGRKRDFEFRLDTPDRLGKAGMHKIGLGFLIGLDDWRTDAWFTGFHLDYLEKKYWKTKFSTSCPRLRPAEGCLEAEVKISEAELVQLICAYRILNENLEISLSTRESASFRNHLCKLGVTSMSAGSQTDPGGYASTDSALEQFSIHDTRTPSQVAASLKNQGYEAVWKDWDMVS